MGCEMPFFWYAAGPQGQNQINPLALVLGRCNLPSGIYWTSEPQHGAQLLCPTTEGVPSLPKDPLQRWELVPEPHPPQGPMSTTVTCSGPDTA